MFHSFPPELLQGWNLQVWPSEGRPPDGMQDTGKQRGEERLSAEQRRMTWMAQLFCLHLVQRHQHLQSINEGKEKKKKLGAQ